MSAPEATRREPPLFACPPLAARMTESACDRLRARSAKQAELGRGRVRPWDWAFAQPLPCGGCPGVRALAERDTA